MAKKERLNKMSLAEIVLSDERTILSKERTALAFMQTGFAAIGVGLLVVKLWAEDIFRAVGIILIVLGFYEVAQSYGKLAKYDRRLKRVKNLVKKSEWGKVEYGTEEE